MPGRTPSEAADAFFTPLATALSCIGHGRITTSKGGRHHAGEHVWTLNGGQGAALDQGFVLKAEMQYRIVEDQREDLGPWRVTTDGYMYAIEDREGRERISWHWHPNSSSPHKHPHAHLPTLAISLEGSYLAREPLATGRTTFEECIRFAVGNLQLRPWHDDWETRLTLAEAPHKLYRTWHGSPEERD